MNYVKSDTLRQTNNIFTICFLWSFYTLVDRHHQERFGMACQQLQISCISVHKLWTLLCDIKMFKVIKSPADCKIRSMISFLTVRHVLSVIIHHQICDLYGPYNLVEQVRGGNGLMQTVTVKCRIGWGSSKMAVKKFWTYESLWGQKIHSGIILQVGCSQLHTEQSTPYSDP